MQRTALRAAADPLRLGGAEATRPPINQIERGVSWIFSSATSSD
jgi:hypothetical protein